MSMPCSPKPSQPVRKLPARSKTSFTATEPGASKILSDSVGISPLTSKMSHPTKSSGASRRCAKADALQRSPVSQISENPVETPDPFLNRVLDEKYRLE